MSDLVGQRWTAYTSHYVMPKADREFGCGLALRSSVLSAIIARESRYRAIADLGTSATYWMERSLSKGSAELCGIRTHDRDVRSATVTSRVLWIHLLMSTLYTRFCATIVTSQT